MARFETDALRSARVDAITPILGAGALIRLYDVAASGTGPSGTLLATLLGDATAWAPAAVAGVLTSNAIGSDTSADASGTALSYARLTSAAVWVEAGDLGTEGVTITNANIAAGQLVEMPNPWVETAPYDDGV